VLNGDETLIGVYTRGLRVEETVDRRDVTPRAGIRSKNEESDHSQVRTLRRLYQCVGRCAVPVPVLRAVAGWSASRGTDAWAMVMALAGR
jgi:hypothetical protein